MEIGGGFHSFALEASNYPLIVRAALRRCPERHGAGKIQILLSLVYLFSFTHKNSHGIIFNWRQEESSAMPTQ